MNNSSEALTAVCWENERMTERLKIPFSTTYSLIGAFL